MKVLFLHNNDSDYLSATLLHGLRSKLGADCVDVPRYDCLYKPLTEEMRSRLRGHGFSVYGLLDDIPSLASARHFWQMTINDYDLIVVADIWAQWERVWQLLDRVDPKKLVILDGADHPAFFPNAFHLANRPWAYLTPMSRFAYFKRELIAGDRLHSAFGIVPNWLRQKIPLPKQAYQISYSIPEEKVWRDMKETARTRDFPSHIVDLEVAQQLGYDTSGKYSFSEEEQYYGDLRQARFGITTKREGWDCLRHYEIAANGCVICFRDLDSKPTTCAPHGLNENNCIIYHSFQDLKQQISGLSETAYKKLQTKTFEWICRNTTIERANEFIAICGSLSAARPL